MSALAPKADMAERGGDVCFVAKAEVAQLAELMTTTHRAKP
jgi:hypothetical protein